MRIRRLLCAVVTLCIYLTVGTTVQASSGKSAINKYNEMLSKPTIQWTNKYDKESTSKLNFALIDFNNDGIPELYVEKDINSGVDSPFQIFSYKGGKTVCIFKGGNSESLSLYYPGKKLIYITRHDRAGIIKTYYYFSSNSTKAKLSWISPYGSSNKYYSGQYYYGTEITKDQFNRQKKALIKNSAANNKIYTKANTAANRKKYLSVTSMPSSLKLSKKNITKYAGTTYQMKVYLAGYSGTLKWSSSDTNVATVNNNGKVTLKKSGKATIKVSAGSMSASCKITVKTADADSTYK